MNKFFKQKFNSTSILLFILVATLIYIVYIYSSAENTSFNSNLPNVKDNGDFLSFLKDPAFIVSIFVVVFTYLIIDRWKSIEARIEKLKDDQRTTIEEINREADKKISDKVEKMIDRAETVDQKVSSLIENHPWIGLLTENNIIPDIPTCHVILDTANKLLKMENVKRALVQEYIYFWVGKRTNHKKKKDEEKVQLEGTKEDFLRLMIFCEDELKDEYLSFLVLQSGYSFTKTLTPYYLRRLIDYGYIQEAKNVVTTLKNSIKITFLSKFIAVFKDRYYMNADYISRCLAVMALFESIKGRNKKSKQYLENSFRLAKKTKSTDYITCVQSEIQYYNGDYDLATSTLKDINMTIRETRKYVDELTKKIQSSESLVNIEQKQKENVNIDNVETIREEQISKSKVSESTIETKSKARSKRQNANKDLDKKSKKLGDSPNIEK